MSATIPVFSQVKGYPNGVEKVMYVSGADESEQPALFWKPEGQKDAVPLLVALHTWSNGYEQARGEAVYAQWCQQVGWAFVHPHFRGPNKTPDALGSDLAVGDVLSAVEFAKSRVKIDSSRIYCIGVSGGGHMSLLMAGRAPGLWAGVSAWCPISDVAAWHRQCTENAKFSEYAKHIEKVLGGAPEAGCERLKSARHRSPSTWLGAAGNVSLDINHGVNDGRAGSVPFTHSLEAWNAVVSETDRISARVMAAFYESQQPPTPFTGKDAFYGVRQPLFRKTSKNTRVTIFDGAHEIVHIAALNWLAAQRKGTPAVWELKDMVELKTEAKDAESGR